jgi:hypothetical protein
VAQSRFGDRRVLLQQVQKAAAFARPSGAQEDRTIDEAQLRRRHLPAGERLGHRDPRHRDVPPFSAALNRNLVASSHSG